LDVASTESHVIQVFVGYASTRRARDNLVNWAWSAVS
jgi:hypothetical protein